MAKARANGISLPSEDWDHVNRRIAELKMRAYGGVSEYFRLLVDFDRRMQLTREPDRESGQWRMELPSHALQLAAAEDPGDYTAQNLISPADAIIHAGRKPRTAQPAGDSHASSIQPPTARAGRNSKAKQ